MKKISLCLILFVILGCASIQKNKLTFKDCVYQCMNISKEYDTENIISDQQAITYLMYLCGSACKEKATSEEWTEFNKMFEIKQDSGEFI